MECRTNPFPALRHVCGGRLGTRENTKRSESLSNRYRSDSSGMLDVFPIQRSSGTVRAALRLTCPKGFLAVLCFHPCSQMPAAGLGPRFWCLNADGDRQQFQDWVLVLYRVSR